jgi:hypothetical protein
MIRIFFITVFAALFLNFVQAQTLTDLQVKNLVNTKHYVFEAQTMTPQRGGLRQLTPGYSLKLAGDSLISYLPYFGRAYTAPVNPSDAGYDFASTNFDYNVSPKKKGSYQISIHTKDKINATDLLLTVYNDGTAYLQVTSSEKQPISFRGYIKQ